MYAEFFDLHTLPFENTPDPRFFYASEQHREALAAIEYVIRMRKGTVLVTGSIGSGKTTIGQTMMHRCRPSATVVPLVHGHVTTGELLGHLLRSLGIHDHGNLDHAEQLERLKQHLIVQARDARPVVVFVDEAQTLSDAALEELRLISNFDLPSEKLMQLVLVGQPELRARIGEPRFDALRQRIVLAKQISPLNVQDAKAYVEHRLRVASTNPDDVRVRFDDEAILRLFAATHGTPRLLNATCDNCLLIAYVQQTSEIGASIVNRAVHDMIPRFDDPASNTSADLDSAYRLAG